MIADRTCSSIVYGSLGMNDVAVWMKTQTATKKVKAAADENNLLHVVGGGGVLGLGGFLVCNHVTLHPYSIYGCNMA